MAFHKFPYKNIYHYMQIFSLNYFLTITQFILKSISLPIHPMHLNL